MDSIDAVESDYNAGYISVGEALNRALMLIINKYQDLGNSAELGFICALSMDITKQETKLADERVARLFAK